MWHNFAMAYCALFSLLLSLPSQAATFESRVHGRVFYAKLDAEKPSFTYDSVTKDVSGKTTTVSTYYDKSGKPLITEKVETLHDEIQHYEYKQLQVEESGSADLVNGKMQMNFTSRLKNEKDNEDYDPTTVVAPMIGSLLQNKWDVLLKGETVNVRYLSIERLETIGFKFFMQAERTLNGKAVVDFLMKPSSIFIAALVDPIRITVAKDAPHNLVESDGRLAIRVTKKDPPEGRSDWKAIDARVEYEPPITATRNAPKAPSPLQPLATPMAR
jgi:hypothetical protein